jgi:hypothetical protein
MPNIIGMVEYPGSDAQGRAWSITGLDGITVTLTKQQIQTFYQSTTGNAASRRAQVEQFIRDTIVNTLGPQVIDPADLGFTLDVATGGLTGTRVGRAL